MMNARDKLRQAIRNDRTLQKSISDQVTLENHAGEGALKTLQLTKIQLNPQNPRKLNISLNDVNALHQAAQQAAAVVQDNGPADFSSVIFTEQLLEVIKAQSDEIKAAKLEKLFFLARSIFDQGLLQPIVVSINAEGQYLILAGERRFLAHVLLGRETVRSMVRQKSHDELKDRSASLVENIVREDLSTAEKIDFIEELVQLYEESHQQPISAGALSSLINESERSCRRYLRFLDASEQIRSQIRKGVLITVREIEEALKKQKEVDAQSKHPVADEPTKALSKSERQGRKRKAITLGKTSNVTLVKLLSDTLEQHHTLKTQQVDWDDLDAVQDYWNLLISEIHKKQPTKTH